MTEALLAARLAEHVDQIDVDMVRVVWGGCLWGAVGQEGEGAVRCGAGRVAVGGGGCEYRGSRGSRVVCRCALRLCRPRQLPPDGLAPGVPCCRSHPTSCLLAPTMPFTSAHPPPHTRTTTHHPTPGRPWSTSCSKASPTPPRWTPSSCPSWARATPTAPPCIARWRWCRCCRSCRGGAAGLRAAAAVRCGLHPHTWRAPPLCSVTADLPSGYLLYIRAQDSRICMRAHDSRGSPHLAAALQYLAARTICSTSGAPRRRRSWRSGAR